MEIKTFKQKKKYTDKDGCKHFETKTIERIFLTKSEAVESLQDLHELLYEFTEERLERKDCPEDKKEKIKKFRNRIGYLKNLKIIIK